MCPIWVMGCHQVQRALRSRASEIAKQFGLLLELLDTRIVRKRNGRHRDHDDSPGCACRLSGPGTANQKMLG